MLLSKDKMAQMEKFGGPLPKNYCSTHYVKMKEGKCYKCERVLFEHKRALYAVK